MFPYEYNEYMKNSGISINCGESSFYDLPERRFKNKKVKCESTKYFEYTPDGFNLNKSLLLNDIFDYLYSERHRDVPPHYAKMLKNTKTLLMHNDIDRVFRISSDVVEAIKRNYNNRGDIKNRHIFYFNVKFSIIEKSFIFIYIDGFNRTENAARFSCSHGYSYEYSPEPNLDRIMRKSLIGLKANYDKPINNKEFTFLYDKEVENIIRNGNMKYDGYVISPSGNLTIKFKPRK